MSTNVSLELPHFARMRVDNFLIFDSILLMFYTALVYVWGLTIHPMGRDYAAMASQGDDLPFLADRLFAWEVQMFGASPVPYHLVNIAALYGCVWCVMHLTNFTVRGIWWMGTWAAAVFMANPVHTESVLNLSGIGDLIPALFALIAMTAYSYHAYRPRKWTYALAVVSFAFATAAYPHHALLFIVIVMFEVLITRPENRNFSRLAPYLVMGIGAVIYHWPILSNVPMDVRAWFAPLYFTFYPIGFLPENAAAMYNRPWLGWVAAIAVIAVLFVVYRKARRPAILFALLSMLVVRLFPSGRWIDPVHLIGGGELVVASGLFTVALAALAYRCMDHPKWKVPIVGMTTAFAVAAFLVQIRAELNWRAAGATVKTFQASAIAASDREGGAAISILPNWLYYRGAPVTLSESIRFETPFSRAVAHKVVLSLNVSSLAENAATLSAWDASGGSLRIQGTRLTDAFSFERSDVLEEGVRINRGHLHSGHYTEVDSADDSGFTLTLKLPVLEYPLTVLPAAMSLGEEAGGDAKSVASDEEASE